MSRPPRRGSRRRLLWGLALLVGLVGVAEVGRRLALSHSLYELNLRAHAPLAPLPPPIAGQRIVIFAPHPDDETLGCGGYLQQAVAAGAEVHVVLMTNGEYPEISVVLFEETVHPRPASYVRLGYTRQRESVRALRYLGLPDRHIVFLGYPNQYLDKMWEPAHWGSVSPVRSRRTQATHSPYANSLTPQAVYCGQAVVADVERVLAAVRPDVVVTVHPSDLHVDHWPTYAVVRFALEELSLRGQGFARRAAVYTYLVHRSHWPVPRHYRPWLPLEPPASLPALRNTTWHALPLTLAQTIDKYKATGHYRTQGGTLDPLLASFSRANELFGTIPIRRWSASPRVFPTLVIRDPQADLDSAVLQPSGDILHVDMATQEDHMVFEVTTRGDVSRKIGYHVLVHAGSGQPASRVISLFEWQGPIARGLVLRDDRPKRVPAEDMEVTAVGDLSRLVAPLRIPRTGPAFFTIRAWTTHGRRTVDQTTVATYRIPAAGPATPHGEK